MKKCLEIAVFALLVLAGSMGLKAVSSQQLVAGIGAPVPTINGAALRGIGAPVPTVTGATALRGIGAPVPTAR